MGKWILLIILMSPGDIDKSLTAVTNASFGECERTRVQLVAALEQTEVLITYQQCLEKKQWLVEASREF